MPPRFSIAEIGAQQFGNQVLRDPNILPAFASAFGVVAVSEVELLKVTEGEATPPKVTVAPEAKLEPARVTLVPPVVGPEVGETLLRKSVCGPAVANCWPFPICIGACPGKRR